MSPYEIVAPILAELGFSPSSGGNLWSKKAIHDGHEQVVFVSYFEDAEYVLVIAPSSRVNVESLTASMLIKLLRTNSATILAKLELVQLNEDDTADIMGATSECAIDGLNVKKLGMRIASCVDLAIQIRAVLKGGTKRGTDG